jgi:hypothetical protein
MVSSLAACSTDDESEKEGAYKALAVCKFAGEQACGYDESGDEQALLLCEVTDEYGRVWMVQDVCTDSCVDLVCLDRPEPDVMAGDGGHQEVGGPEEPACVPDCTGKDCGDDGCGGVCALCPPDHKCGEDFKCKLHCEPQCAAKQCGDDGCGGTCGDCPFGMTCQQGLCGCTPQCEGKDCGADGCGGTCGDCPAGTHCSPFGKCEAPCKPACEGKQCGDDGCGGLCGQCAWNLFCSSEGLCTDECTPQCEGKECGPDGCFGSCGFCPCPACPWEATQCTANGLCTVPEEGKGCSAMLDCMSACPDGDQTCLDDCYLSSSPAAQALYQTLVDCIIMECGAVPSDQCMTESLGAGGACEGDLMACYLDG